LAAGKNNREDREWLVQGLVLGGVTFALAVFVAWPSQAAMRESGLWVALPVLLLIVVVGVLFDIVGVSVAVADEAPFHAMSAKRIGGARQALALIRNADRVASLCNDIVGDLAGTVSGAAAAAVVFRLVAARDQAFYGMLAVGIVAALTVGGKAAGKGLAIRRANAITFRAGKFLYWVEGVIRRPVFSDGTKRPPRKRGR